MAVSNLQNRNADTLKGSKRNFVRFVMGTGSPIGDTKLANDQQFPIGSEYTDISTSIEYVKTAAGTWRGKAKFFATSTALADGSFFIAARPCKVVSINYVHSTAGSDGSAVNLQVEKVTGTTAPGSGSDLLSNNTNAGFNCKGTINTVQNGTLKTTAGLTSLAAGDRLCLDYAGTLTALAGVVVTVELEYL